MQQLIVNGMHCNACISLVNMELEDNGLDEYVEDVSLLSGNKGRVVVNDLSKTSEIQKVINSMNNYQIDK